MLSVLLHRNRTILAVPKMYENYTVQYRKSVWHFEGRLLSEASSREPHKPRWIEFKLFKTSNGNYILSRVGMSVLYHSKTCKTSSRNNLKKVERHELPEGSLPCLECGASEAAEVFPETHRYFALRTTTAKGVLAALIQYDDNNSEYLTNVAVDLLTDAAVLDDAIDEVFFDRVIE